MEYKPQAVCPAIGLDQIALNQAFKRGHLSYLSCAKAEKGVARKFTLDDLAILSVWRQLTLAGCTWKEADSILNEVARFKIKLAIKTGSPLFLVLLDRGEGSGGWNLVDKIEMPLGSLPGDDPGKAVPFNRVSIIDCLSTVTRSVKLAHNLSKG